MEVVLSQSERAYPEVGVREEAPGQQSCLIGVAEGHELQIHLHRGGDWQSGVLVDIVVDGALRRSWKSHHDEETHIKFLDQVTAANAYA